MLIFTVCSYNLHIRIIYYQAVIMHSVNAFSLVAYEIVILGKQLGAQLATLVKTKMSLVQQHCTFSFVFLLNCVCLSARLCYMLYILQYLMELRHTSLLASWLCDTFECHRLYTSVLSRGGDTCSISISCGVNAVVVVVGATGI